MKTKRGQQEIVGFVLIVVVIVIGMMIFLIISLRDGPEEPDSLEVGQMLDAIMKHTTDCAIVYEPDYDNFEDLFKSCYRDNYCSNLDISACDYLNESLRSALNDLIASEVTIDAYQLDFFVKNGEGILQISEGNCSGYVNAAKRNIRSSSSSDSLTIIMKTCSVGFDE